MRSKVSTIIPWILKLFLHVISRSKMQEGYLGDVEEVYSLLLKEKGKWKANFWVFRQILFSLPGLLFFYVQNSLMMLKNYFKIGLRMVKRYKGTSFINVLGLALGLTLCLLVFLWVQNELSFDRFHADKDRLFRLVEELHYTDGKIENYAISADRLALWLEDKFPEIEESARFFPGGNVYVSCGEHHFYESSIAMADPSFLQLFSFKLEKGDQESALDQPNSLLLTRRMASKYFGNQDPIGQILILNEKETYQITGVLEAIPRNSHLQFDFLVPIAPNRRMGVPESQILLPYAYVRLSEGANKETVNTKIRDVFPDFAYTPAKVNLSLQPLDKIHLYSNFDWDISGHGSITMVRLFSLIAVFVLLIACINFMNLTTAQSQKRVKEVGVRKVLGSSRRELIQQFYGETFIVCFFAFLLSLLLTGIVLPFFNSITEKNLSLNLLLKAEILGGFALIILFTTLIAGSYTALHLSSLSPVQSMKRDPGSGGSLVSMRRFLVVFQFVLSMAFIICSLVVVRQIKFIQNTNLGYNKEQVLTISTQNMDRDRLLQFKQACTQNPNTRYVSFLSELPTSITKVSDLIEWEGKPADANILMRMAGVDADADEVFQLGMEKGRFFNASYPTDLTEGFVINQAAARAMDLSDPVGQKLVFWRWEGYIIGVIKDFHFQSLHQQIEPLVMKITPQWTNHLCIRVASGNIQNSLQSLEILWKGHFPNRPFTYHFLDEMFEALYLREYRLGTLMAVFTLLAVCISCLGLYGLISFVAEQKTKEIGIRKVNGANLGNILILLNGGFIRYVLFAFTIASPLAYFVMTQWLKNYAYRTTLAWWIFALAGLGTLVIAILTVSYQSFRAARTNPIEALRYE